MAVRTENHDLIGWRKQFGTLCHLFQKVRTETLERVTAVLLVVLIMMLPVEMAAQMFSIAGVYSIAYGILGMCFVLMALVWLGKRIFTPEVFICSQWTICDAALLAMLGWSVISTLAAPNPIACFYGDVHRNEGLATYFIYASVYISLRHCTRRENIRLILMCFVIAISVVSVFSCLCLSPMAGVLKDYLGMMEWDVRLLGLNGAFDNSNHFSYMLGVATVVAGGLFTTEHSGKWKPAYLIMYALLVYTMVLNGSMGGYVAAIIGIGAYFAVACIRKDQRLWKVALLAVVFLVVSNAPSQSAGKFVADVQKDLQNLENPEESVSGLPVRLVLWKSAMTYIAQRPLLGYGPDGSGIVQFVLINSINDRPHNEYLQYAIFLGIPGLVMYLTALGGLLGCLLRRFRDLSPLCVVLACAVLTYCASAFVGNTMYYTTIYYVAILAMLVNESVYVYSTTAGNTV